MVPLSSLLTTRSILGPEYTNRFNLYRAAQIIATTAPGYSSGQAMAALEQVAKETLPTEIGYDWSDLAYQEQKAAGSSTVCSGCRLCLCFSFLLRFVAAFVFARGIEGITEASTTRNRPMPRTRSSGSTTATLIVSSADRRLARTHPAEPAPTIM
jgi:AcrB/AcrD/AcrF family